MHYIDMVHKPLNCLILKIRGIALCEFVMNVKVSAWRSVCPHDGMPLVLSKASIQIRQNLISFVA